MPGRCFSMASAIKDTKQQRTENASNVSECKTRHLTLLKGSAHKPPDRWNGHHRPTTHSNGATISTSPPLTAEKAFSIASQATNHGLDQPQYGPIKCLQNVVLYEPKGMRFCVRVCVHEDLHFTCGARVQQAAPTTTTRRTLEGNRKKRNNYDCYSWVCSTKWPDTKEIHTLKYVCRLTKQIAKCLLEFT